jgi:hypothetical protein
MRQRRRRRRQHHRWRAAEARGVRGAACAHSLSCLLTLSPFSFFFFLLIIFPVYCVCHMAGVCGLTAVLYKERVERETFIFCIIHTRTLILLFHLPSAQRAVGGPLVSDTGKHNVCVRARDANVNSHHPKKLQKELFIRKKLASPPHFILTTPSIRRGRGRPPARSSASSFAGLSHKGPPSFRPSGG